MVVDLDKFKSSLMVQLEEAENVANLPSHDCLSRPAADAVVETLRRLLMALCPPEEIGTGLWRLFDGQEVGREPEPQQY